MIVDIHTLLLGDLQYLYTHKYWRQLNKQKKTSYRHHSLCMYLYSVRECSKSGSKVSDYYATTTLFQQYMQQQQQCDCGECVQKCLNSYLYTEQKRFFYYYYVCFFFFSFSSKKKCLHDDVDMMMQYVNVFVYGWLQYVCILIEAEIFCVLFMACPYDAVVSHILTSLFWFLL